MFGSILSRSWLLGLLLSAELQSGLIRQSASLPCKSQMQFTIEDGTENSIQCPVTMNQAMLQALMNDELVKQTMTSEGMVHLPATWFLATTIELTSSQERDLLVIGQGPLLGANVSPFWILRPQGSKWQTILAGAPAHDLLITSHRTMGYRDIELISITATTIFTNVLKFDGSNYRFAHGQKDKIEPIQGVH